MIDALKRRRDGASSGSELKGQIEEAVRKARLELEKDTIHGPLDWSMDMWIKQLPVQTVCRPARSWTAERGGGDAWYGGVTGG
eukprot:7002219-Prymnesium_polylepis.1